jgi:hypothetical protein
VTINDVTVTEGNSGTTTMTFTVTRSDNTGAFSVAYATANDTAVDTSDFVAASGTLTFTVGGALTDTIAVTINGDTLSEVGGEQFFVNLSGIVNTVGVASLTDAQGKGTIADDEPIISTPYTHLNRDVLTPNTNTWPSGGITIGTTQFVNLGLQGVGRVPANAIDAATGESLGSISDMQVTDFVKTPTGFSGKFHFLPDRGYNSGVIFSNYAARINAFDFTFTPYTSSSPTAAQNQVAMTFTGSTRFTYDSGAGQKYTTGTLADSTLSLLGTTLPSTAAASTQSDGTVANRLTMDAEGLVLDKRCIEPVEAVRLGCGALAIVHDDTQPRIAGRRDHRRQRARIIAIATGIDAQLVLRPGAQGVRQHRPNDRGFLPRRDEHGGNSA